MKSDTEQWERLQELFHRLDSVPEADYDRVLNEAGATPELQQRVRALLRSAERNEAARQVFDNTATAAGSKKIGPYSVLSRIGSGGVGAVYLAQRQVAGVWQRVAIKVLGPHAAGPSFVERFQKEQRILALLDHPNITRMLDAGLDADQEPYLVMEFVEGQHLDSFCDDHRLSIDERLKLFLAVCDAVGYAHRNLVVHLDLKPSNILVTESGTPKLLDFGTSKLISTDAQLTTTLSLTPSYASPEQLRNEPATTACDIYSLGVILYELLSGGRPRGEASIAAIIEHTANGAEPAKLNATVTQQAAERRCVTTSRLRSLLSGDLSTIVRKCLSSRPRDRYASANELSIDIHRFMEGRPILARRQTTVYFLAKFVKRNRSKVAAGLFVLFALAAVSGYALWQQRQALAQGQRSLRMQTFLYRLFQISGLNDTGKPAATVKDFLKLGVKVLPEYIHDPADLRQAQLSLAESMYQTRDYAGAQPVFQEVMANAEASGDVPTEAEAAAYAGSTEFLEGHTVAGLTLTAKALALSKKPGVSPRTRVLSAIFYATNREDLGKHTEENVKLLERAVKESRENHLPPHETGDALMQLGGVYVLDGRLNEAQRCFEEAVRVNREDPLATCDQSDLLGWLAQVLFMRGRAQESLPVYQESYEKYRTCAGPEDPGTLSAGAYWAGALVEVGRAKEAISMLETALPTWRRVYGHDHYRLVEILYFLSLAYVEDGRYPEAERTASEAISVSQGKIAAEDRTFGMLHFVWARALAGEQRYQEALPHAKFAADILSRRAVSPAARTLVKKTQAVLDQIQEKLSK